MWMAGSNATPDGAVNSPSQSNAKYPKQQAAHIVMLSREWGALRSTCRMFVRMSGVMGTLGSAARGFSRLSPFNTRSSCSVAARGSGVPQAEV